MKCDSTHTENFYISIAIKIATWKCQRFATKPIFSRSLTDQMENEFNVLLFINVISLLGSLHAYFS